MIPDTESEVRAMRAAIYGECTDNNWEMCKNPSDKSLGWLHPDNVTWLKGNQPSLVKK